MTTLRQIANGWIMIVDGRRLPFGYASPFIVVLGTLAQRSILSRTFITVPWWISSMKIYQIPPITDYSIMSLTNFAGSRPPENGCTLPRRIIGLMLWSDATHLTAFGMAKLWPLYVCMGNESKYMRCWPSSNLCSHAAYFHTVRHLFILVPCNHLLKQSESSLMHSKILQQKVLLAAPLETAFSHIATGNYFTHSGKSCLMTNLLKHIITG